MKFQLGIWCLVFVAACAKPMVTARVEKDIRYVSESFAADRTNALAAVKWALNANGYSIATENATEGIITTTWLPTTSDSHYIDLFNRHDFGVNGAYHQLEVFVAGEDGRVRIDIGSRVKAVVPNLKSTGIEEKKVLNEVANYLRKSEPNLSNIGLQE